MPTRKPKAVTDIRSMARQYTTTAIKTLAAIAGSKKATDSARVAACQALLDRGFGKPEVHVEVDETIRWILTDETMSEDVWTKAHEDSLAAPTRTSESTH